MMGEGKEEKKRDTLLYYIGEIYRREGKGDWMRKGGGFAEKGRGKGHFGEEKGCFEEENRGRNWDWERDKLKNRWGIDGSWTGNQTRAERELNEN